MTLHPLILKLQNENMRRKQVAYLKRVAREAVADPQMPVRAANRLIQKSAEARGAKQ